MDVIPETFYLAEVIDSAIAMITPLADTKNLKLLTTNMPPPGLEIYTDRNKTKQILINLLNNAVKFTERGQIEINTNFTTEGDEIEISVSDTGIGIKEEALDSVFDEFRQIEGTVVRDKGGVGLGLSISKKLVELLKGEIRAESEYGVGSKFTFSLPLQAPPARPEIPPIPKPAEVTRPLVLTVEDNPEAQEMLRIYLEDSGYQVIQAYTGKEAVNLAREHKLCAITLDIIMPGQDGWDVLQELKSTPETADIPVIMVSIVDNRELGLSMGAIAYLIKPVDHDELIKTLRNIERENGIKINRVLVVDDNPADVELIAAFLDDPGIDGRDVLKAYGGADGIKLARKHCPDLIVLDLMMPDVDGFEVIKRLRRSKKTKDIPILIVTGKELSEEEQEFLRKNIRHIMIKGKFTKEDLLESIKETLERVGQR
ncbi:Sensor histidine kinase RcsC [subsurface metagenome]